MNKRSFHQDIDVGQFVAAHTKQDEKMTTEDKQEKKKVRRINIVVPIETLGSRQEHLDTLDAIDEEFRNALRLQICKSSTSLSGYSVERHNPSTSTLHRRFR